MTRRSPKSLAKRQFVKGMAGKRNRELKDAKSDVRNIESVPIADRLRASRENITRLETGHQGVLREHVAELYACARILFDDPDEWKIFIDNPEWPDGRVRPNVDQRKDALRHALRFGIGFGTDKKSKQAANSKLHKLVSALQPSFNAKVYASEIPRLAEEKGGWENWGRENRAAAKLAETACGEHEIIIRVPRTDATEFLLTDEEGAMPKVLLLIKSRNERIIDADCLYAGQGDHEPVCTPTISPKNTKPGKSNRINSMKAKAKGGRSKPTYKRSRS